jgi:hypothetical protein
MANFTYKDFNYDKYKVEKDSDVDKAKVALESALAKKPNAYQSQWQTQLNDTIDKIMNREKFSYDLNGDALYQQYKDKFSQQGKMASADVIGQASAMTGGYGNSYAATVGNQMYQKELQNLNDIIPELYQMAYDRYNREGQDLYNQYAMLGEQENLDYAKHRDTVSDYFANRDYYANRYDSERNFDYSKYVDDRNFTYGKYADDKSYAYNDYRNAIEDAQWQKQYDETVRQNNLEDAQWQKQFDETERQNNLAYHMWLREQKLAEKKYEDSMKVDPVIEPGNDIQPKETQNTSAFVNRYPTKDEYINQGHSNKEFNEYMESNIASFLRDDRISEEEALWLIDYYGL